MILGHFCSTFCMHVCQIHPRWMVEWIALELSGCNLRDSINLHHWFGWSYCVGRFSIPNIRRLNEWKCKQMIKREVNKRADKCLDWVARRRKMRTWWKGADATPRSLPHSPELVLLVWFFSFESGESSKKKKDIFQERIKHRKYRSPKPQFH